MHRIDSLRTNKSILGGHNGLSAGSAYKNGYFRVGTIGQDVFCMELILTDIYLICGLIKVHIVSITYTILFPKNKNKKCL